MINKNKDDTDSLKKKLEKIYKNYGLDTSNMSDDEFERMREFYCQNGKDIDEDLKESERHKDRFVDDIV
jgi:hypothetical protein